MGLKGKLETDIEIQSSADLFHELIRTKPHHLAKINPVKVQDCELHSGNFGNPGCHICWKYTFDGKSCVAKQIVEVMDDKGDYKEARFKMLEGDLLREYKSFVITIQVISKGKTSVVKWILDYEKLSSDISYPTKLMDYFIGITKDIEAHHLNA